MDKFDKSQLKTLCRGNRTDRGWTQNPDGNWTPSVFDRRRLAVSTMTMVAEGQGGMLHGPVIGQILTANSTDAEDFKTLADNFNQWMAAQQQG